MSTVKWKKVSEHPKVSSDIVFLKEGKVSTGEVRAVRLPHDIDMSHPDFGCEVIYNLVVHGSYKVNFEEIDKWMYLDDFLEDYT